MPEQEDKVLGYVLCRDCMTPKQIIQGSGKRARFLRAKCECGASMLTGAKIQAKWAKYKTLEEVQAQIKELTTPTPLPKQEVTPADLEQTKQPSQSQTKPSGAVAWVIGGALAAFGLGFAKLAKA
ncbi:hypothetical protein [Vibrio tritonius]|uniref:hypothetical protein n=1 Tax=Vibrio tritonius TaxID=1435069 RepID=UPI00315D856D